MDRQSWSLTQQLLATGSVALRSGASLSRRIGTRAGRARHAEAQVGFHMRANGLRTLGIGLALPGHDSPSRRDFAACESSCTRLPTAGQARPAAAAACPVGRGRSRHSRTPLRELASVAKRARPTAAPVADSARYRPDRWHRGLAVDPDAAGRPRDQCLADRVS